MGRKEGEAQQGEKEKKDKKFSEKERVMGVCERRKGIERKTDK